MTSAAANPIQEALSGWGLPWSTPTRELAATHGVKMQSAYRWEVLEFADAFADLPGMVFPVYALARTPQSPFPPDYFAAHVWVDDDVETNLGAAADYFAQRLARGEISRVGNTLTCEWTAGPASVKLTVWPPELELYPHANPAHEREPRLARSCAVAIHPGFKLPLSAQERRWLESATVVFPYPHAAAPSPAGQVVARPEAATVAYARDPEGTSPGLVSISGEGAAVIISGPELLVIPVADILRVSVSKLLRAKGPGGIWLDVVCVDHTAAHGETALSVRASPGPDDLDADARLLGRLIDRPVTIGPAYPDS